VAFVAGLALATLLVGAALAWGANLLLGWYDDHTVLLVSRTSRDDWILGWDVLTGQVTRVAELDVDAVALGPDLVS